MSRLFWFAEIQIDCIKGGMNTKLHTLSGKQGRPIRLHIIEGQCGKFKGQLIQGVYVLLNELPRAESLLGQRL